MVHDHLFDLAGFADAGSGLLGRKVPTGMVFHPGGPVRLTERSTLQWEFIKFRPKAPTREMLDHFITLWKDRDGVAILKFAEKWGPLRIQDYCTRLPIDLSEVPRDAEGNYNMPIAFSDLDAAPRWAQGLRRLDPFRAVPISAVAFVGNLFPYPGGDEPLTAWRFFSHRAFAILRIAGAIKNSEKPDEVDWGVLVAKRGYPVPALNAPAIEWQEWERKEGGRKLALFGMPSYHQRFADPARVITNELAAWMRNYPIKLSLGLKARGWEVEIDHEGSLLSAIGLQLALIIAGKESLFVCSGCGLPYVRTSKRMPNAGQANFCEKCGNQAALHHADCRRREKISQSRRLYSAGVSPADIATRLGVRKVATVRGWLKKRKSVSREAQE